MPSDNTARNIIRAILKDKGMPQNRLAAILGWSLSAVNARLQRDMKCADFFDMVAACDYEIIVRKKTPGGRTKKYIRVDSEGGLAFEGFDTDDTDAPES